MPNTLRPSWIQQGQMLPRLMLNLRQDKTFLERINEELQNRKIQPKNLIPIFQAAERGSSQAQTVALRIGEAFDRFFRYLAVTAISSNATATSASIPQTPSFTKGMDVLAQNLDANNKLIQQNLQEFNFDFNLEDEEEETQSENLQNSLLQTTPFQNTPKPNSSNEEEKKNPQISHPLKKEMKRELALETILKLTPKIKKIAEDAKEIGKIAIQLIRKF